MNIYLLKRDYEKDGQDEYDATLRFAVVASDELGARQYAADYRNVEIIPGPGRLRDEDPMIWFAETTTCEVVGIASEHIKPGVILEDHQAG